MKRIIASKIPPFIEVIIDSMKLLFILSMNPTPPPKIPPISPSPPPSGTPFSKPPLLPLASRLVPPGSPSHLVLPLLAPSLFPLLLSSLHLHPLPAISLLALFPADILQQCLPWNPSLPFPAVFNQLLQLALDGVSDSVPAIFDAITQFPAEILLITINSFSRELKRAALADETPALPANFSLHMPKRRLDVERALFALCGAILRNRGNSLPPAEVAGISARLWRVFACFVSRLSSFPANSDLREEAVAALSSAGALAEGETNRLAGNERLAGVAALAGELTELAGNQSLGLALTLFFLRRLAEPLGPAEMRGLFRRVFPALREVAAGAMEGMTCSGVEKVSMAGDCEVDGASVRGEEGGGGERGRGDHGCICGKTGECGSSGFVREG